MIDASGTDTAPDEAQSLAGLEIGSSGVPPIIEQAAILYANDETEAATAVLVQAIRDSQLGTAAMQAWRMLLDAHQFLGRKDEFEALAIEFAARFETSPPAWRNDDVIAAEPERASGVRPSVALPAVLDAGTVRTLEAIERAAQRGRGVTVDCRAVRSVDLEGASVLRTAFERLESSAQPAAFVMPEPLVDALRATVQTGRRDDDASAWLLLLDLLRLLGQQAEFEDISIDYCITYEVSPPSWTPAAAHMSCDSAPSAAAAVAPPPPAGGSSLRADAYALAGDLRSAAGAELAGLRAHAERHAHVYVDCRDLKRLDFVTAGQLLNLVTELRAVGRTFEFGELSHMVAALLAVMGLHELATMTLRKL